MCLTPAMVCTKLVGASNLLDVESPGVLLGASHTVCARSTTVYLPKKKQGGMKYRICMVKHSSS